MSLHKQLIRNVARCALPCLFAFATCGGSLVGAPAVSAHEASVHTLDIVAHDNGNDAAFHGYFSQRTTVPTGLVEVRFHNDGSQDHMAQFFKLKGDVSESTVKARLAAIFSASTPSATVTALHALLDVASAAGGADSITPGASQDVIERLTAGHYVVVCFDTTSNGTPHFLLGMFKGFWAIRGAWAPEDNGQPVADGNPVSNGTVIEFDHKIVVPRQIRSHEPVTLKIRVYDQTHEFQLLKVPEHTTASPLQQCFMGPPNPCTLTGQPIDSGGAAAIAPGSTHWVELHLVPGTYAALCFVPDIETGMPHALMGMITVFTVRK